jgi:hypothetical protein
VALAVAQRLLEGAQQAGAVVGVDEVGEGAGDQVAEAAAEELQQRRGGGHPVQVGGQPGHHADTRAADDEARRGAALGGAGLAGGVAGEVVGPLLGLHDLGEGLAVAGGQGVHLLVDRLGLGRGLVLGGALEGQRGRRGAEGGQAVGEAAQAVGGGAAGGARRGRRRREGQGGGGSGDDALAQREAPRRPQRRRTNDRRGRGPQGRAPPPCAAHRVRAPAEIWRHGIIARGPARREGGPFACGELGASATGVAPSGR